MTTRKSHKSQVRLVEVTIEILLENGLRATTTRAVTQRAGVGTGLLNHYFRWPELRAVAWRSLFEEVAKEQFSLDQEPELVLERYFSEAFIEPARPYWQLWIEAIDLATSDPLLKNALRVIQKQMQKGMTELLHAGCEAGRWRLEDPDATAVRLGALYDGLVGLLITEIGSIKPVEAEAHLRKAFILECDSLA